MRELSISAICIQGWFHCRGEERPNTLIGARVARQQMSSRLGGGLPVEEGESRKRHTEKWRWKMMTKGVRLSYNRVQIPNTAKSINDLAQLNRPPISALLNL